MTLSWRFNSLLGAAISAAVLALLACGGGSEGEEAGGPGGGAGGGAGGGGGESSGCAVTYSEVDGATNAYTTTFGALNTVGILHADSGDSDLTIYAAPETLTKLHVKLYDPPAVGEMSPYALEQQAMSGTPRWENSGGQLHVDAIGEGTAFAPLRVSFRIVGAMMHPATTDAQGSFRVDVACAINVASM